MTDKQAFFLKTARHLDNQHPDRWTRGSWYPATNPDGSKVEICKTQGRGRSSGKSFLHIRKKVPTYLIHHGTGERERIEDSYRHGRINLATGDFAWIE